jgi:hypothetical protein
MEILPLEVSTEALVILTPVRESEVALSRTGAGQPYRLVM